MRPLLSARVSVVAALVVVSCGGGQAEPQNGGTAAAPTGDSQATDFTLPDVEGNQVSLSQYLGKGAVVIDFWATWCKPCIAEMVHLQKMYDAKKDKGLVVIAISMDSQDTIAQVAPFVKNKGFTFPVLLDEGGQVVNMYNPRRAAPFTILIDKSGKVVKRREGFNAGDEVQLEKDVEAAMK